MRIDVDTVQTKVSLITGVCQSKVSNYTGQRLQRFDAQKCACTSQVLIATELVTSTQCTVSASTLWWQKPEFLQVPISCLFWVISYLLEHFFPHVTYTRTSIRHLETIQILSLKLETALRPWNWLCNPFFPVQVPVQVQFLHKIIQPQSSRPQSPFRSWLQPVWKEKYLLQPEIDPLVIKLPRMR